jgi:hypothetical protein
MSLKDDNRKYLYSFYSVANDEELIAAMERHITRLIDKMARLELVSQVRTHVREG